MIAHTEKPQEQLAKLLLEKCGGSKWFAYTTFSKELKKGIKDLTSERIIELIESAPREAYEAAYYDAIDSLSHYHSEDDEMIDNLTISGPLSFDNIWMEDDRKNPGNEAWVRIQTTDGFKVVHAKFIRISLRNIVQKEHDIHKEFHKLKSEIRAIEASMEFKNVEKIGAKLKELQKRRMETIIMSRTGCAPVMAKIQRTKTKYDYIAATDVHILEDQDMYERLEQSRRSVDIKVKTIYNNKTHEQVHYMRQRGISKQRAEIMANLEGTSISYDIQAMFAKESITEI